MEVNGPGPNFTRNAQNAVGETQQYWSRFTNNVDSFTSSVAKGQSANYSMANKTWLEKAINAPVIGFSKIWNGLVHGDGFINPTNGSNNFIARSGRGIARGIKSSLEYIGVTSANNINPRLGKLPFAAAAITLGVGILPGAFKTLRDLFNGDIKGAAGEAGRTTVTGLGAALTGAALYATGAGAIIATVGTVLGTLIGNGVGKAIFQRTKPIDPSSYYNFNNGYDMPYMPVDSFSAEYGLPPLPMFGRQGPSPIRQLMMQEEAIAANQPYGNGVTDKGYMRDLNTYIDAIT